MWQMCQCTCFNTKRKQHSMNTQDSLKVQSRCINLQHFYMTAKCICNILTPEPGFHGDTWLPHQPAEQDRAEVISPSHEARKHLCVQEHRKKNEDSLLENWERDWGKNEGCTEQTTANKRPHWWSSILLYCPSKLWHLQIDHHSCGLQHRKLI